MELERDDYAALFAAMPTPYLVLSPSLDVVTANSAFLAVVGRTLDELQDRPVFDAFPPGADDLDDQGSAALQGVFERVRDSGTPRVLPLQKYDILDLDGARTTHYWSIIVVPVHATGRRDGLLLLRVEDVTDWVDERERGRVVGDGWRRRAEEVEADLYARAQELSAALKAKEESAARLASLAEVALQLTAVESVEQLEDVVVGHGLRVLGADGGAVVSLHEEGGWRITANTALGEKVQVRYGHLPHDSPLPATWTARTGERLLLPDREAGLAFFDGMRQVYADTLREAWAFLPLQVRGESLGALAVAWAGPHVLTPDELEVLDGFAAQCGQALDRIRAAQAQREASAQVERMSEALQVSLLTSPPAPPELDIAARYLPAMVQAQVGGDWFDAFVDSSGRTLVSVGDVAGHDRSSAAAMAQVRSLLRGLAVDSGDSPAVLLGRLDRALETLELDLLATALLARVEGHALHWSSAGHPPPVVCLPDGTVRVLEGESDLLLGLDPRSPRSERVADLPPGSTLVLCTDGLVERRDEHLDDGLARLAAAVGACCGEDSDEVCDAVLAAMLDEEPEDDVALLVVRVR